MRLDRLIRTLDGATATGDRAVEVTGIEFDSRRVAPGDLFVAVPAVGGDADSGGARFVEAAVQKGAAAIIVQDGARAMSPITTVIVPDARAALADVAAEFYDHPSRTLKVFGVTGTDGKTTTTYLLQQLLAAAGFTTGLNGTVETIIAGRRERHADRMTTPESLDVQRLLRRMVDAGVTHVALEASSHALALDRLRGCAFAACALTNITADHVEFHGSWEAYFAAKTRLFAELGAGKPAVLNRDDPNHDRLRALISGPVITYALETDADVRATDLRLDSAGSCFLLWVNGRSMPAKLPLAGRFNISNALAAVGLATVAGVSLDITAAALASVQPPSGRMERVDAGQNFTVMVDYAHTTNAFRTSLAAARRACGPDHRVIAVFGAAGGRDRAKRPIFARIARELADYFIITNEDPFGEEPGAIIAEIAAGAPREEAGERYDCEPDRGRAIQRAVERARTGDTVLILGKGHETSIVTGNRTEPWSDVQAARRALGDQP